MRYVNRFLISNRKSFKNFVDVLKYLENFTKNFKIEKYFKNFIKTENLSNVLIYF